MVLIVVITRIYEAKGNFTSVHKQLFSVIMIGLSLLLGLNFNVSTMIVPFLNIPTKIPTRKLSRSLQML